MTLKKAVSVAVLSMVLAAALAALAIGSAAGETVTAGNVTISVEGKVTPTKLSKTEPTPITLNVSGTVGTLDGTRVPPLKTIAFEFDKAGAINTEGLPTCSVAALQSTLTAQAKQKCASSLVGTGSVAAEIALPEQPAFTAHGPLLIFNGKPKGGRPVLIFHVHANVPAPTTFVTSGVVAKASGRYGTSTEIAIPTIVGGQGSLTSFKATLHKTWTYKGKKESLLTATCPAGKLLAHGVFTFVDGTAISGEATRPCTGTG